MVAAKTILKKSFWKLKWQNILAVVQYDEQLLGTEISQRKYINWDNYLSAFIPNTYYYVIRTFMVDRLAVQITLTALSHFHSPLLID